MMMIDGNNNALQRISEGPEKKNVIFQFFTTFQISDFYNSVNFCSTTMLNPNLESYNLGEYDY